MIVDDTEFSILEASQSFVGINYGEVADNLPPPSSTSKLLQSTTITKLRLYGVNPPILHSLANTGISVIISTSNADIPSLAADPSYSSSWVKANILPFHPLTTISTISVGNEVFLYKDNNLNAHLLGAMENLHSALVAHSLDARIKISTVHPMSIITQSDPPSAALFDPNILDVIKPVVSFLQRTGGSFMINPYPYFAYQTDPTPETLAFCLFQPNKGRFDSGSGYTYANMFDAQVDAVRWALRRIGSDEVDVVVAETGWPYRGDDGEKGASLENAKAYNGNLVAHLRSMIGTPLMPGKSVDTYLFALYDEDLKMGHLSERSFGIYRNDLTMMYDVALGHQPPPERTDPETSGNMQDGGRWCVPKEDVTVESRLQRNVDYACGQPGVDCRKIQPGGECYQPNTVASHAAYAMNLLYQISEKQSWNCDFDQTGTVTDKDPSSFPVF